MRSIQYVTTSKRGCLLLLFSFCQSFKVLLVLALVLAGCQDAVLARDYTEQELQERVKLRTESLESSGTRVTPDLRLMVEQQERGHLLSESKYVPAARERVSNTPTPQEQHSADTTQSSEYIFQQSSVSVPEPSRDSELSDIVRQGFNAPRTEAALDTPKVVLNTYESTKDEVEDFPAVNTFFLLLSIALLAIFPLGGAWLWKKYKPRRQ